MRFYSSRRVGNFDLLSQQKEVCLEVLLPLECDAPHKAIHLCLEIGDEDDQYYDDPFEMAEHINDVYQRRFWSTQKEKVKSVWNWMEENESKLRVEWFNFKINKLEEKLADYKDKLSTWQEKLQMEATSD